MNNAVNHGVQRIKTSHDECINETKALINTLNAVNLEHAKLAAQARIIASLHANIAMLHSNYSRQLTKLHDSTKMMMSKNTALQKNVTHLKSRIAILELKNADLAGTTSLMNASGFALRSELKRHKSQIVVLNDKLKNLNHSGNSCAKNAQKLKYENAALFNKSHECDVIVGRLRVNISSCKLTLYNARQYMFIRDSAIINYKASIKKLSDNITVLDNKSRACSNSAKAINIEIKRKDQLLYAAHTNITDLLSKLNNYIDVTKKCKYNLRGMAVKCKIDIKQRDDKLLSCQRDNIRTTDLWNRDINEYTARIKTINDTCARKLAKCSMGITSTSSTLIQTSIAPSTKSSGSDAVSSTGAALNNTLSSLSTSSSAPITSSSLPPLSPFSTPSTQNATQI